MPIGLAYWALPARPRRRRHDRACGPCDRAVAGRQGNLVRDRSNAVVYRRRLYGPCKLPTRSVVRFGSPRFPDRSPLSGITPLLHLAAVLSISIGLLNLFPVPLLDGGHLLFYAAEVVRGRPLSDKSQEIRIPHRTRPRTHADGVCHLQRRPSGALAEKPVWMTPANSI